MEESNRRSDRIFRLAGLNGWGVWIIVFLCLVGSHAQRVSSQSMKPDPVLLGGQHLFEARCASCHGLNGRGGERAPDIVTRPEVAKLSEQELLGVVRKGIPSKGMPAFEALPASQLSGVVQYVRSMQGKRRQTFTAASMEDGRKLFNGKARCAGCHMVRGVGGFLGPDLSNYAANHSAEDIRSAILTADKRPNIRKAVANITMKDGRNIAGLVRNEDNFSIQIQSLDGAFHLIDKSDASDLTFEPKPLMPNDYSSQLTQSELESVVAYLVSAISAK